MGESGEARGRGSPNSGGRGWRWGPQPPETGSDFGSVEEGELIRFFPVTES